MPLVIYGNDGGTANFGYTVTSFGSKRSFKFLEIGMFVNTINNLTENPIYKKATKADKERAKKKGIKLKKTDLPCSNPFSTVYPIFYNSVNQLIEEMNPTHIIAERFQTRGIGGPLIESVSMMNGTIATIAFSKQILMKLVVASQWKNEVNKLVKLESLYEHGKQYAFTPHECDSSLMTLYYAHVLDFMPLSVSLGKWKKAISDYARRS